MILDLFIPLVIIKIMNCSERISPQAITALRNLIEDADGNEVMFVGEVGPTGLVENVTAVARGNESSVPALTPYLDAGDAVIHNHPSGVLKPSGPDLQIASQIGNQGIGFYIIDNNADRIYVASEPVMKRDQQSLDVNRLSGMLAPGGELSKAISGYEPRDGQIRMLEAVAESFNENSLCAIEAGTGVGKSFAYLIPALKWASTNGERVVVSTGTINLQQQLLEKDIPMVKKILGTKIKTVLVKGRGNYLCKRRMEEALEEYSLFKEEGDGLEELKDWAEHSETGSRSDLAFLPDPQVWAKVCSESDACLGLRCRFREGCFVLRARKEASAAHVLVVNHHLLFSDLSLRVAGAGFDQAAVLPPFQRIVFDEAHNIENSATSFFSLSLNKYSLGRHLSRLYGRKRGRSFGAALGLQGILGEDPQLQEIPAAVGAVRDQMDLLDSMAQMGLGTEGSVRVSDKLKMNVLEPMNELHIRLLRLIDLLEQVIKHVPENEEEAPPVYDAVVILKRLEGVAEVCESFKQYSDQPEKVFWFERSRTSRGESYIRFFITPLDISKMMREAVYEPYETVVCTSATLSVKNSFSYWAKRVGLTPYIDNRLRTFVFQSPFPYAERVLLGVPLDAPDPTSNLYQDFVSDFTAKLLTVSEGKGLVLFTSYSMLQVTYSSVKPKLESMGITVMKQGDADRSRLLARFRKDTASVLFATDSFWEGVDTPGDSLQMVIICRLPFRVPTNPVVKARMDAVSKSGGNPFMELSLPEAVMKLKQGFGRLMRRHSDRGGVVILDPRVIRKSYGSLFLSSLPPARRCIKEKTSLLTSMENFLVEGEK